MHSAPQPLGFGRVCPGCESTESHVVWYLYECIFFYELMLQTDHTYFADPRGFSISDLDIYMSSAELLHPSCW
jgi:hypothetical protein